MLRNLAAADELLREFLFRIRIRSSHSRAQGGLWAAVKIVLNRVSRLRMVRVPTFVALVHWMDERLVCEELLPLSSQLSLRHVFLFHE